MGPRNPLPPTDDERGRRSIHYQLGGVRSGWLAGQYPRRISGDEKGGVDDDILTLRGQDTVLKGGETSGARCFLFVVYLGPLVSTVGAPVRVLKLFDVDVNRRVSLERRFFGDGVRQVLYLSAPD